MNYPLISAIAAIFFAQAIKLPIAYFSRKSPSINIVTSTGGMPSSHSAAVASLIASLIFQEGFSSPFVAIATIFGVIVMFDSMGVRRQSGELGVVINQLLMYIANQSKLSPDQILQKALTDQSINKNIDDYEDLVITKYKGHKPTEVFAGIITGGFVALILQLIYFKFN
ncbi:divergent PAP2 family protein [Facklamia hominis]|uniref:divergent PAP2 family protein n=1 Tax=Facklamia hominis TaxID=178214 RepID=UPI0029D41BCD|nr:divergent PAP2 family protein [Facklamia hominis]WPJ90156.1 divergent PAP2 family protein [Facklamia hominis]